MVAAVSIAPEQILDVFCELGPDERLRAGQNAYGRLDVANDSRDWRTERAAELADVLVYGAIAEVAAASKRPTK